ncbi:siderophore ABC transporter substrate-binding protein [Achromobacter xylosoxidans]|uniref:siderophore ABC transporter substrate-binding protein n=1 Tax=Alcaligenes xylosoxydans xylosoxydans TaxID=85698 RepID=UPI0029307397|nr:siderophore ABC transporter substrate-binding protein [Achromobacter xylosoxidans]WOB75187.1 siderophore ABC transporter substrate-binding protein [Achromobacter xylosoxidans]
MSWKSTCRALGLAMIAMVVLQACGDKPAPPPQAAQASPAFDSPISITHKLGTTTITRPPRRVAVLDMNEADTLDQLGVPIVGMTKDYVPHFLARYKEDASVLDLGAIVQPNLERVHALKPDLILISPIQANHYRELSEIAPTLHFDVDFGNSKGQHLAVIKDHLMTLGRLFGKEDVARRKAAELDAKVAAARRVTEGRPEKAMIVMFNNGAFSSFGVQSRYAFVFDALGVRPASTLVDSSLHGQPISSEFIQQANPDILYVVDRTAVMERRPVMDAERMSNPLLRQTNAWKNGRVVFVDADAWYTTAASVTSLQLVIDDVIKGYQD